MGVAFVPPGSAAGCIDGVGALRRFGERCVKESPVARDGERNE